VHYSDEFPTPKQTITQGTNTNFQKARIIPKPSMLHVVSLESEQQETFRPQPIKPDLTDKSNAVKSLVQDNMKQNAFINMKKIYFNKDDQEEPQNININDDMQSPKLSLLNEIKNNQIKIN